MSEERKMRIVERNGMWCVQYGWTEERGSNKRFIAVREWPANDLAQAHAIAAREQVNAIFDPLPVHAHPMVEAKTVARAIAEAPEDVHELVRRGVAGLTDPLPTVEESHHVLEIAAPIPKGGGRQFYVYLAEPVYGRLVAMAAAAGTGRNRMIEALVLAAGED